MRILAGQFKGRKLLSPPGGAVTRPITGIAKKSLFDMLGGLLPDSNVLDLYCGTGTLGLEALSRGAERCAFVERDRAVIDRLKRNIETIEVQDQCEILRGDATRQLKSWLASRPKTLDLVFVDPPYADSRQWNWRQIASRLFEPFCERLDEDGVVVLRTSTATDPPETLGPLQTFRTKRYGDMRIVLYRRSEEPCESQ